MKPKKIPKHSTTKALHKSNTAEPSCSKMCFVKKKKSNEASFRHSNGSDEDEISDLSDPELIFNIEEALKRSENSEPIRNVEKKRKRSKLEMKSGEHLKGMDRNVDLKQRSEMKSESIQGDLSTSQMAAEKIEGKRKAKKNRKEPPSIAATEGARRNKGDAKKKVKEEKEMKEEEGPEDKLESAPEHIKELAELETKDPEFYKFLKEQDPTLLDFNDSDISDVDIDDESDEEMENDEEEDQIDGQSFPTLKTDSEGRKIIDEPFLKKLEQCITEKEKPSSTVIRMAIDGFLACVARVGADIESPNCIINDGALFEWMIRLCFERLSKAIYMLLGPVLTKNEVKTEPGNAVRGKRRVRDLLSGYDVAGGVRYTKWSRYNALGKRYIAGLLLFLNELQTPSAIVATINVISDLTVVYIHYKRLIKKVIRALIKTWSRKPEECRCAALFALCKLIKMHEDSVTSVIKACYMGYVSNVRKVTSETWPSIIFMQKSFGEICLMQPLIAYHYTFTYIRQLAIHVRNATIAVRQDLMQTIYNWQFMQCLYLWARVIAKVHKNRNRINHANSISELAYPLCQITISTMKLFPSMKYMPLRLHCLRILLILQVTCGIYIQTMALATQLLDELAMMLRRKPSKGKGTIKNIELSCMLKATASHLEDAGFRQNVVEELFKLMLEAAYIQRDSLAFYEMEHFVHRQLKSFLGNCRNPEASGLFKSLSVKLSEHAKYSQMIVATNEVDMRDPSSLSTVRSLLRSARSPLAMFYESWQKAWKIKQATIRAVSSQSGEKLKTEVSEKWQKTNQKAIKTGNSECDVKKGVISGNDGTDRKPVVKIEESEAIKREEETLSGERQTIGTSDDASEPSWKRRRGKNSGRRNVINGKDARNEQSDDVQEFNLSDFE
ncbi:hypothetical protein AB6A40_006631 [Gnathostoma spinigerum]|uniref:Nucleolar complex protein 2 homolog n=1 Tax=Gnathostoma spinigerum TaxID=75299 RepID=A0ABD6ETB7_9BILA